MEDNGRWVVKESAEKQRIDLAHKMGQMKTVQIKTLEKLNLLDPDGKDENTILFFTDEQRDSLHDYITLLLKCKSALDREKRRWNQRHVKACCDPQCQKIVPRDTHKCPECGLDTKWYRTDEKGHITEAETKKTPPARDVQEAHPILHNDASEIVDKAQSEAKRKLVDRATASVSEYRHSSGPEDLRAGSG